MKQVDFLTAIEILTAHHSNEVIINKSTGHGSTTGNELNPTLHIKNCVASAVNKLIKAGYSLSMNEGLMSVDKY